jgi:hypothetical protein
MRFYLALLLFLVVAGCSFSGGKETAPELKVSVINASLEETFMKDKNITMDRLSVLIENKEDIDVNCSIFFEVQNTTNASTRILDAGIVSAGSKKKVNFGADLLRGESSMRFDLECDSASII